MIKIKTKTAALAILGLLALQTQCFIVDPSSVSRYVDLEGSYGKLLKFIKSGGHDKHKNTPDFYEKHGSNAVGHCGPALAPHAWKMLGFTVASMKGPTT